MKHSSRLLLPVAVFSLLGAAACLPIGMVVACAGGDCASEAARHCACEACGCDRCCTVQETKTEKKWAYSIRRVPYCLTKCPNPFQRRHDCGQVCPTCEDCVRYKSMLVKRPVTVTKTVCKCVPGCQACQARQQATPLLAPPPPGEKIAQPGEPLPIPPTAGPEPANSP